MAKNYIIKYTSVESTVFANVDGGPDIFVSCGSNDLEAETIAKELTILISRVNKLTDKIKKLKDAETVLLIAKAAISDGIHTEKGNKALYEINKYLNVSNEIK